MTPPPRRAVIASVFLIIGGAMMGAAAPEPPAADLTVFTREGCPHCAAAAPFLDRLTAERPDLRVIVKDVGRDPAALAELQRLAAEKGITSVGVPAFSLRGELLIGWAGDRRGDEILALLERAAAEGGAVPGACPPEREKPCRGPAAAAPEGGTVQTWFGRLSLEEMGLPAFTLALGLVDGFNPCAMWVLLFLLSLLVNLRDRWKMFLVAATFVAVSGLAYFALMAAWLNVFLLIGLSRGTEILLGAVALVIGAINVKDFLAFGRGPTVGVPEAVKPGLYARIRAILSAENLPAAVAAAAGLAVLVNVVELLCTAGFPALYTRILTMQQLAGWEYYGYLALYNLAYVLDDSVMVGIAVVTLSSRKLQERGGRWLKLISGTVMLGLGAALLARPGSLR